MAEESFAQYPGAYLYPEDNDLVDSIASLEVIDSQNGESSGRFFSSFSRFSLF